jgi:hypothetical protein
MKAYKNHLSIFSYVLLSEFVFTTCPFDFFNSKFRSFEPSKPQIQEVGKSPPMFRPFEPKKIQVLDSQVFSW